MITFETKGSFTKTENSINRMSMLSIYTTLRKYGEEGRKALSEATPKDSGETADSWSYRIEKKGPKWELSWHNEHRDKGFPVAIRIQYGYGTGTGGYVEGEDYINPAIKPIFEKILQEVWKEVTNA